jgi:hypothetical protein
MWTQLNLLEFVSVTNGPAVSKFMHAGRLNS